MVILSPDDILEIRKYYPVEDIFSKEDIIYYVQSNLTPEEVFDHRTLVISKMETSEK